MTEDSAPKDATAAAPAKEQPSAQVQPAPAFPHPDAAKKVEDAAAKASAQVNTKALNVRQWLESAVVPVVRLWHVNVEFLSVSSVGIQSQEAYLDSDRSGKSVHAEFLAAYLVEHNPKKKQKVASQQGNAGVAE